MGDRKISAYPAEFTINPGEIEIQHQIAIAVAHRMLSDIEVTKQGIELVPGADIIIMQQQIQRQALAEAAGTDEKEESVGLFYQRAYLYIYS